MKSFRFSRYAFSGGVAVVLLAGCGGPQPPIGAPGAMPQASILAMHAERSTSWMKRGTSSSGNLLYVSNENVVAVFALPAGELVGTLSGFSTPVGLCSDKDGNVFVVDEGSATIVEYAHGGTNPIATLSDSGNGPDGCYVDPTTRNLAVVGGDGFTEDNVAVYADESGLPTVYKISAGGYFLYCTYDDKGNLFTNVGDVAEEGIYELPKGGSGLVSFSINKTLGPDGGLQWDGKYLAIENARGPTRQDTHGPTMIYQVKVVGSSGQVVRTILLKDYKSPEKDRNPGLGRQFWIQDGLIFSDMRIDGPEGVWQYPRGGHRILSSHFHIRGNLLGVTESVAPSEALSLSRAARRH
jgi:hypothetical protein